MEPRSHKIDREEVLWGFVGEDGHGMIKTSPGGSEGGVEYEWVPCSVEGEYFYGRRVVQAEGERGKPGEALCYREGNRGGEDSKRSTNSEEQNELNWDHRTIYQWLDRKFVMQVCVCVYF